MSFRKFICHNIFLSAQQTINKGAHGAKIFRLIGQQIDNRVRVFERFDQQLGK